MPSPQRRMRHCSAQGRSMWALRTVRSLTAVVDDADCAVSKLQSDDCGINIIIVSITGIRQDSTGCRNFCNIAAGQITDHVKVMDHHVGEDAAGNCYIRHGRAGGIAGSNFDNIGSAELAGSNYVTDCLVASVEAADETDLELDQWASRRRCACQPWLR